MVNKCSRAGVVKMSPDRPPRTDGLDAFLLPQNGDFMENPQKKSLVPILSRTLLNGMHSLRMRLAGSCVDRKYNMDCWSIGIAQLKDC